MLGTRDPQGSLFQVPFWAQGLIDSDSFYARMAKFWPRISRDEELAMMYSEEGRRSLPPSMLTGVLILQQFDNVSDRDAAERVRYDLRWKLALGLPLGDKGFHYSSLCVFRRRLMEHKQERYAFDALLSLAIEAGFLVRDAEQVIDSTPIHGAAALQDTYTLIRNGLRKLLLAMGEKGSHRHRLVKRLGLSRYLSPQKPDLDWADPKARQAHLQELVADARRLLEEVQSMELEEDGEAAGARLLLEQLLEQDIREDDEGKPTIRQGVAKDRVISTVDPEMRHGRKSSSTRFDGYKGHIAVDPESELITAVAVTPANVYDGEAVETLLDTQEQSHGLKPSAVAGDHAVIDAERRHMLEERGIAAVGKVTTQRPGGRYAKADFQIDLLQDTMTCPAGHTLHGSRKRTDSRGRPTRCFIFAWEQCQACEHRARCTTAQGTGRTVHLHAYEALLQDALVAQQAAGFLECYRSVRSTVERVIAHLARHGFRQGRYFGAEKTLFQALWSAAAVNLQRLMGLISARDGQQALPIAA
jgi:transposase